MNLFIPVELEIMDNVESIVEDSSIGETSNTITSKTVGQAFDGSERSFARLLNDYYLSQVAVGDPIRSKRTKRA